MAGKPDPMAEIRASFFVECEELLESLQDALNALDDGDDDLETINVAFRAVHSIKGGAGAFGLNALVAFAHRFETVMDAVRSGKMAIESQGLKLFFLVADRLADHVAAARTGGEPPAGSEEAIVALEGLLGGAGAAPEPEEEIDDFVPTSLGFSLDLPGLPAIADLPDLGDAPLTDLSLPDDAQPGAEPAPAERTHGWTVRVTPQPGLYASGNEPLYLLRALAELGEVEVICDHSRLPKLAELDATLCFLTWTVHLTTAAERDQLREIFDFVEDVATIEITPTPPRDPGSPGGGDGSSEASPSNDPGLAPLSSVASLTAQSQAPVAVPPLASGAANIAPSSGLTPAYVAPVQPPREALSVPSPDPVAASLAPSAALAPAAASAPKAEAAPTRASVKSGGEEGGGSGSDGPAATVRVDVERIDKLVNLVGELVINQAMLQQSIAAAGLGRDSAVMNGLESFMMLTRDIQDSVMVIRAQPVKPLFQRMARIVREASALVSKTVRLKTEGDATEVDKTVIERLADPLTHMIRNAVDHGLESTEKREAAGKPSEGVITLRAQHRSGRVVIDVADDGGGIDREKVLSIAKSKGLVAEDAELADSEIDNLLFLPGFSTASTVSNLSGRGVGMDVVKRAIQALGGRITIETKRGEGTCFSISLPLTLAVLDGMIIRAAGETLVVPLSSIVETAVLEPEQLRPIGASTNVIHIRGDFVPLLDLGAELGFRSTQTKYDNGIILLTMLESGERAALIVDEIVEQRQVVIKGLHHAFGQIPGIAAATILGDGQIALILDPADLVASAGGRQRSSYMALAG